MTMDHEKGIKLPSQGSRIPSDKRASPTVPEARSSSSSVGPSPVSPTGTGNENATAVNRAEESRDPLDLTFVDCPSISPGGDEPVERGMNRDVAAVESSVFTRSKCKRKAKVSPDVITHSDEERTYRSPRSLVALRKLRSKKKKPKKTQTTKEESAVFNEECSSVLMSTESEKD